MLTMTLGKREPQFLFLLKQKRRPLYALDILSSSHSLVPSSEIFCWQAHPFPQTNLNTIRSLCVSISRTPELSADPFPAAFQDSRKGEKGPLHLCPHPCFACAKLGHQEKTCGQCGWVEAGPEPRGLGRHHSQLAALCGPLTW